MFNQNVLNVLWRNFITDSMSHAYHTKTSSKGNRGEISRELKAGETCTYSHVPLHMQAFEKLMLYLDGFSHLFSCSGMAANWDQRRNFSLLIIERRNANHERNIYEMPSICFDNLTGYGNYPSQSKAKGYSFWLFLLNGRGAGCNVEYFDDVFVMGQRPFMKFTTGTY